MNSEAFMKTAHLLLGLSRKELQRRVKSGQVDPQILQSQLEQNSQETKLEALCEKWIELKSLEQADIFSAE